MKFNYFPKILLLKKSYFVTRTTIFSLPPELRAFANTLTSLYKQHTVFLYFRLYSISSNALPSNFMIDVKSFNMHIMHSLLHTTLKKICNTYLAVKLRISSSLKTVNPLKGGSHLI